MPQPINRASVPEATQAPTDSRSWIVYCDESRHDAAPANKFLAIGGLWVPREDRARLRRRLDEIAARADLRGEWKWSKVSDRTLDARSAPMS